MGRKDFNIFFPTEVKSLSDLYTSNLSPPLF